jgi:ABC-2 type transport system ATP-binding protein
MDCLIELINIKKRYDGFTAVENVSFKIKKGEIFSIIGPNGAGKSTILKIICGLIKQTEGMIKLNNMQENDSEFKSIIGYMPEEIAVYEDMSVKGYLRFFAGVYDVKKDVSEPRIEQLLKFLNLEDKTIGNLSKGMKRKVLLARSLINNPEILVYDEPASGLDPVTAQNLLAYIIELKKQGKTIIMSAHDLTQVEEISDTILILNRGKIDVIGSISDIKSSYEKDLFSVRIKGKNKDETKRFSTKKEMVDFINKNKPEIISIKTKEKSLQEIFVNKYKNE